MVHAVEVSAVQILLIVITSTGNNTIRHGECNQKEDAVRCFSPTTARVLLPILSTTMSVPHQTTTSVATAAN